MEVGAGAISAGWGGAVTIVGSLKTEAAGGSAVFLGMSSAIEVAGGTAIEGSEVSAEGLLAPTGCPQFVQKVVPGCRLLPQLVQEGASEGVPGTGSAAVGEEAAARAGTASATFGGWAFSLVPHSVQKAESGSPCAPHEEQTGRATVTAAVGWAAIGIGLPHDVQKLADSSTRLPHDVQRAIHFAPGIRTALLPISTSTQDVNLTYFPVAIFSTSCE
jgi:hypothetical protein